MGNPRIVRGRKGTDIAVAVRGHVLDAIFLIGVPRKAAGAEFRMRLEDHLLEEARSLIRRAKAEGGFDWEGHHFERNRELGTWEKRLNATEIERLLRG